MLKYLCGLTISLLILALFFQSTITSTLTDNSSSDVYETRPLQLLPKEPQTLYDFQLLPDRFQTVYHDPDWKHPAYHPNWYSTNFRWSNAPISLAYQQHQIFSYQGGMSCWFDLSHYLALPDQSYFPSPINYNGFTIKYSFVTRLIAINAEIASN